MPIGIQTFEMIITEDYVYVDKTAWVHKLANEGACFFLGRLRRFGKSLLVSTLKAYFEGKKELFRGLAIEGLERDWTPYPVFHIDLTVTSYRNIDDLEKGLDANLRRLEKTWGADIRDTTMNARFYSLIRRVAEESGQKVIVLVDAYDDPFTQAFENGGNHEEMRRTLIDFYGVLKSADRWLHFVLLTGVVGLPQDIIHCGINQLRNISTESAYLEHIKALGLPELISHRYAFDRLDSALDMMVNKREPRCKVLLHVSD
jgi:hypothetical protein